jgi:hypothetical protein
MVRRLPETLSTSTLAVVYGRVVGRRRIATPSHQTAGGLSRATRPGASSSLALSCRWGVAGWRRHVILCCFRLPVVELAVSLGALQNP